MNSKVKFDDDGILSETAMGLKPIRSAPPRVLHPVQLRPDEILTDKRVTRQSSADQPAIDWHLILTTLAPEAVDVHERRGFQPDTNLWFYRMATPEGVENVVGSMRGAKVVGWEEMRLILGHTGSREELLIQVGRVLCRLLSTKHPMGRRTVRGWFTQSKVAGTQSFWLSPSWLFQQTNWCGLNSDLPNLFRVMDDVVEVLRWRTGIQVDEVAPPTERQGWDLSSFAAISSFVKGFGSRLSTRGVVLDLIQRQREGQRKEPTWNWKYDLTSMINRQLGAVDRQSLPTVAEEWKVSTILALGLPGGVKLPAKLQFGLDYRNLEKVDMRLTAITEQGQAIYLDTKGKIHSEGNPIPKLPAVANWGKAVQIWMTAENHNELLAHWYEPPVRCPWSWYEKWGNQLYKADGSAHQPDPKFRPQVQWLEQTG